jgi:hypothetical protein
MLESAASIVSDIPISFASSQKNRMESVGSQGDRCLWLIKAAYDFALLSF